MPEFYLPKGGRDIALKPSSNSLYTGLYFRNKPVSHDVNSLGYRGPELETNKPSDEYRIALIGDSNVYGQGVNSNGTVSAILQDMINNKNIKVMNFGCPGYNIEDNYKQLKYFANKWDPDMVILFICGNDHYMSLHKIYLTYPMFLKHIYLSRLFVDLSFPENILSLKEFDDILKAFQRLCNNNDQELLVSLVNSRIIDNYDIKKRLNVLNIPFIELLEIYNNKQNYLKGDLHLSKNGNSKVAKKLFDQLRKYF